jgi:thiamine-monophosphate kinase
LSTPSNVGAVGEHALIDLIRARVPAAPPWLRMGIGDDAAVVEPVPRTLDVVTTDALVEGVHFDRRFTPADAIGHRALAVNLSDLAAMGADPRIAVLSLILPADLAIADLTAMIDGLMALAVRTKTVLAGGNITRTPGPLSLSVTAIGSVHPRKYLVRSGARPGDEVWVSGRIGAAAAGLASLAEGDAAADPVATHGEGMAECREAYLRPEPQLRLGHLLAGNRSASSCIDLSDGLADGLHQIAAASNAGIVIDGHALPIPTGAREWWTQRQIDPVMAALRGGDDYELLFTVSPRHRGRFRAVRQALGALPLTRIGTVTIARTVRLKIAGGECPVPSGYEHFR